MPQSDTDIPDTDPPTIKIPKVDYYIVMNPCKIHGRGFSSGVRVFALHAKCRGFKSPILHFFFFRFVALLNYHGTCILVRVSYTQTLFFFLACWLRLSYIPIHVRLQQYDSTYPYGLSLTLLQSTRVSTNSSKYHVDYPEAIHQTAGRLLILLLPYAYLYYCCTYLQIAVHQQESGCVLYRCVCVLHNEPFFLPVDIQVYCCLYLVPTQFIIPTQFRKKQKNGGLASASPLC